MAAATPEGAPNAREYEHEVVERSARALAKKLGGELQGPMRWPEEEHPVPEHPVDGVAMTSIGAITLEHTYLESFEGELQDNRRAGELLGELVEELSGTLATPGHYVLDVAVGAVEGHRNADLDRLKTWIRTNAGGLGLGGSGSRQPWHYVQGRRPELPFDVTLYRFVGDFDPQLRLGRPIVFDELGQARELRAGVALDRKLPKLEDGRRPGGITALVFETNDVQLVNIASVTEALVQAASRRPDLPLPDVIMLIRTSANEPWYLEWPKLADAWYPATPCSQVLP